MNQFYIKFVVLYQFFAIVPNPGIVSRVTPQPVRPPIAGPRLGHAYKKVAEIPPTDFKPAERLEPVPTPATTTPAPNSQNPTANSSQGGCVAGYVSGDFYLDKIIAYESGGNSCATNPGGCFGLLQACPGEPLRAACGGDPGCQIAWFQANKTGGRSWATIWQHELAYGWW